VDLSIIIVNYNVRHFAELTIESALEACKDLDAEIILVDNNSTDGSLPWLSEQFPSVRVIANQENTGFAVANNQGIREASGRYILLLNPDTVVAEDTFKKCLAYLDTHPDTGGLGVRMLDGSGRFLPESKRKFPGPSVAFFKAFGLSALFRKSRIFGQYHLGYLDEHATHEVDVLAGAFMLLRKEALVKTGLLDETFFMYGEDIDLSYRIRLAGYKNVYFHEAPIIHFKGESTKKGSLNYVQMFYNAMKIFARKHFSGQNRGLFIFLINLAIYFRAGITLLAGFTRRFTPVLTDLAIIFVSLFAVKEYWEYYVRYIDGGTYPDSYLYINIPVYASIWILSMYLSGSYDRDSNPLRILRGIFWGTIVTAAVYGFLPEHLRFSRGMIVAGAATSAALLVGSRYVWQLFRFGHFRFGESRSHRILLIGHEQEARRAFSQLESYGISQRLTGFCGEGSDQNGLARMGSMQELTVLLDQLKPGELIYCLRDTGYKDMISFMDANAGRYFFMMLPKAGPTILGSHSKNNSGYQYDLRFNITTPYNRRLKRLSDILIACFVLLTFPVQLLLINHPAGAFRNAIAVCSGRKTWVGYGPGKDPAFRIPSLQDGVLHPSLSEGTVNERMIALQNSLYAREYTLADDLRILIRNYRQLGR